MAKKKILVACGTGIATSTVVVNKVKETLAAKGLDVIVDQCKASEVPGKAESYDLIIATTPVSGYGDKPMIRTLSFLTGIGIDKDVDLIIEKLNG